MKIECDIEHVALWTDKIEEVKDFYTKSLGGISDDGFEIPDTQFKSYFITFNKGPRLEIMQMPGIPTSENNVLKQFTGYIHLAFRFPSSEYLDSVLENLKKQEIKIIEEAHWTLDHYYEATILDPSGNRIELTVIPDDIKN